MARRSATWTGRRAPAPNRGAIGAAPDLEPVPARTDDPALGWTLRATTDRPANAAPIHHIAPGLGGLAVVSLGNRLGDAALVENARNLLADVSHNVP